jgi:hypothetical protein
VIHLIHSFLPVYKVSKIFAEKKGQTYKCCILNEEVLSVDEQLSIAMSQDMKQMIAGMLDEDVRKKNFDDMKAKISGREIGVAGQKTDKYLSLSAFNALQSFMMNEILSGNKELNGLTRSMMRNGE